MLGSPLLDDVVDDDDDEPGRGGEQREDRVQCGEGDAGLPLLTPHHEDVDAKGEEPGTAGHEAQQQVDDDRVTAEAGGVLGHVVS